MSGAGPNAQQDRLNKAAVAIRRLQEKPRPSSRRSGPGSSRSPSWESDCRFPGGADSPAAFWALLDEGRDAVQPLDGALGRWSAPAPRRARAALGRAASQQAVDCFDADVLRHRAAGGGAARPAAPPAPGDRLGGARGRTIPVRSLEGEPDRGCSSAPGRPTTFYLVEKPAAKRAGCLLQDRQHAQRRRRPPLVHARAARAFVSRSTRLARRLSWRRTSRAAACAPSECDRALAGGVHLRLSPDADGGLDARTQTLSPDGRGKTFDAWPTDSSGERAAACWCSSGSRTRSGTETAIWALIRGSAINQDGRSAGLTAPNVLAQEALRPRRRSRAPAPTQGEIGFVETHGTGTVAGRPDRGRGARTVLGARAPPRRAVRAGGAEDERGAPRGRPPAWRA